MNNDNWTHMTVNALGEATACVNPDGRGFEVHAGVSAIARTVFDNSAYGTLTAFCAQFGWVNRTGRES